MFIPNRSASTLVVAAATVVGLLIHGGEAHGSAQVRGAKKTEELTAKQVFERYKDAIVRIETDKGSGTGFLVAGGRLVATCYHLVEDATKILVTTMSGERISIVKVGVNKEGDAALLTTDNAGDLVSIRGSTTNDVSPGDEIYVIGNPLGFLTQSITTGVLSGKRQEGNVKLLQITAPISPGSSGSPIIDKRGRAIGFVSFTFTRGQALNMGVALAELIRIADRGFRTLSQFYDDNRQARTPVPSPESPQTGPGLTSPVPSPTVPTAEAELALAEQREKDGAASEIYGEMFNDIVKAVIAWELENCRMAELPESAIERSRRADRRYDDFVDSIAVRKLDRIPVGYFTTAYTDRLRSVYAVALELFRAQTIYIREAQSGTDGTRAIAKKQWDAEADRFYHAWFEVYEVISKQPWFNAKRFVAGLDPPVVAFWTLSKTFLPDPELTNSAVVAASISSGFKAGDVIVRLSAPAAEALDVTTWNDVAGYVHRHGGKTVVVTVVRNGERTEVVADLK